ncbi:putative Condensation domain-containing protein [Seiridium cardinale]
MKICWTDGSEVARLPPRSDDLLDTAERQPGRGEQRASEILAPLTNMHTPITVPVPKPLPPCSQRNALLELKLSARTTQAISAACNAQRLSVTAAWHAAAVLATQSLQAKRNAASGAGPVAGTQFACFGNLNLRRYFPAQDPAVLPDAYALSNRHGVLPYVVEPEGKTFAQLARELAAFYQQDLPKADPEVWSALGPMIRVLVPDFVQPQLEETTPALSSLGVIDNFIGNLYAGADGQGDWRVEDVWFGDTVTGPRLECFMWAWRGRISINTCYNPA